MPRYADRFGQYTADEPRFTPPPEFYKWDTPERPAPPSQALSIQLGGGHSGGGVVHGTATGATPDELDPTDTEKFVARWRASEERARQMRDGWSQATHQSFNSSP